VRRYDVFDSFRCQVNELFDSFRCQRIFPVALTSQADVSKKDEGGLLHSNKHISVNTHRILDFFIVTTSAFYSASIVIVVVCVRILYRSLLYFEVKEEYQEQGKLTIVFVKSTTDFFITSSILNGF
jgi:hypothetical protein